MTTATKPHKPQSISALLDAPLGGASFQTKPTAPPWSSPHPAADAAPAPAAEGRLLTVAEAAAETPLSAKQWYRVAEREDGPFRKVEGRLMAYEADLHNWIRKHPTGTKPDTGAAAAGDSLADRVRRRRNGGAS
jgi:hypothetical protein